ncbi:MAG: hypothetical protein ABI921_13255 [Panacibacter sp.]
MISNNTAYINLTKSQAQMHAYNANVMYATLQRNSGKTSAGIGLRVLHLSQVMPGAQILLFSDTFERLQDVLVPGILSFLEHNVGMVEGVDYVCYKAPPEHWKKPLFKIKKFDKVISFATGFCICLASQKVSGSANGYNAFALIVDEAKFIHEEKLNTEVLPAVRGNIMGRMLFGHLPEYCSKWYFTDKWGENIKWILKKRNLVDKKSLNALTVLMREIMRLQKIHDDHSSSATKAKYKKQIDYLQSRANAIRRKQVYFCDALPYENMMVAGKKYFRDQKRDLSPLEYDVAILNYDPDRVPNVFYPSLSRKQHFYKDVDDVDTNKPLLIAMDYQWRITPMVVAQLGNLPGSIYKTLNFVAGIHTLHPNGGIKQTVDLFCEKYKDHACKIVHYFHDHTAIGKRPDGESFYDTGTNRFIENGWIVVDQYIGKAPTHHERFQDFIDIIALQGDMGVMFNEVEAEFLIKSMQQAGAISVSGMTKKDKSKEKNLKYPAEEQTDYSEAWDQLVWGFMKLNMYQDEILMPGGIYTGVA